MMEFTPGQAVKIPCSVEPGAFPGERLVTIESDGDRFSGFVRAEFIQGGFVLGTIISVEANGIQVKIPGSFFTKASGTTSVSPGWANSHLQPALA